MPPLIKTTAFIFSRLWFINFVSGRSRAAILIGLARKSQRVRLRVHPRPICTYESVVEGVPAARQPGSRSPDPLLASRRGRVKKAPDLASDAAFHGRPAWTS